MKNRILAALTVATLAFGGVLFASAPAAATQPDFICPDGGAWVKVDGVNSLTATATAPAGKLIAEVCYKASDENTTYPVTPPAASVKITSTLLNNGGQVAKISHYSVRLVDAPTPPQPEDKVTFTEWVDGVYACGDTTVEQSRTKTTTVFVLNGNVWVEGGSTVTVETQTRDLTKEELDALVCETEPPTETEPPAVPEPPVLAETGPVDFSGLWAGALGLLLLGAGSLLVQRLRRA